MRYSGIFDDLKPLFEDPSSYIELDKTIGWRWSKKNNLLTAWWEVKEEAKSSWSPDWVRGPPSWVAERGW